MNLRFVAVLSLAKILAVNNPALAQSVTIRGASQEGHGFMIRDGGQCYVIMPRHLAGNERRVTVLSAAPVINSTAYVETPFWDGLDLAIGTVRGDIEKRCTVDAASLDVEPSLETGARVVLQRLLRSGELERVPMQIDETRYLTLEATVTGNGNELYQGTSGAILFAGEQPAGMAIEQITSKRGRFIRVGEIHINIHRWLNRRSGFAPVVSAPAGGGAAGLPASIANVTLPPVSPEFAPENMFGEGAYVFDLTQPNRLVLRLAGTGAAQVSRITIIANPDADYSLPRDIRIEVSSLPDGTRARPFAAGQMAPDGLFEAKGAATLARWVFITVGSGFSGARIGIERMIVE